MTPLAGIKAAITSLLDQRIQWSTADISVFHGTINAQTDRLNRVISEILDLNRIESGDLVPDQAILAVDDLLSVVGEATAYATLGRVVTMKGQADLVVVGDRALITQALVNLVENAAKYSAADGEIRVVASHSDNEMVVVRVEDDGPGIAQADLSYVFQPYYRAESARRVRGSGLGLTIVKSFVELCGGTVAVERLEQGTRFVVTLRGHPAMVQAS
jgi:signal transduction histidine kinase